MSYFHLLWGQTVNCSRIASPGHRIAAIDAHFLSHLDHFLSHHKLFLSHLALLLS